MCSEGIRRKNQILLSFHDMCHLEMSYRHHFLKNNLLKLVGLGVFHHLVLTLEVLVPLIQVISDKKSALQEDSGLAAHVKQPISRSKKRSADSDSILHPAQREWIQVVTLLGAPLVQYHRADL